MRRWVTLLWLCAVGCDLTADFDGGGNLTCWFEGRKVFEGELRIEGEGYTLFTENLEGRYEVVNRNTGLHCVIGLDRVARPGG